MYIEIAFEVDDDALSFYDRAQIVSHPARNTTERSPIGLQDLLSHARTIRLSQVPDIVRGLMTECSWLTLTDADFAVRCACNGVDLALRHAVRETLYARLPLTELLDALRANGHPYPSDD